MKTINIIILTCLFFGVYSCKEKKKTERRNQAEKIDTIKAISKDSSSKKTEIVLQEIQKQCDETFEEFFYRFSEDSSFQKRRVKYPLKFLYDDYESDSLIVVREYKNHNEYKYFDFSEDKNAMQRETDKYTVEMEKTDHTIKYQLIGYDNGILVTYKFELINNCWYMVGILDEST